MSENALVPPLAGNANVADLPPIGQGGQVQQPLPHDLRDIVAEPFLGLSPWQLATLVGAVIIFLVLGYLGWRRWRSRRPKQVTAEFLDPWELLLAKIKATSISESFTTKDQGNFFFELSLLMREAIELCTAIAASDMTLRELRAPLREAAELGEAEKSAIWQFLERADMVKFAEAPATKAEALAGRAQVEHWTSLLRQATKAKVKADSTESKERLG